MTEWAGFTLIDLAVVVGVVVVLPLAIGGAWWRWAAAGAAVAVVLPLDRGLVAAVGVLPWLALTAAHLVGRVRRAGPLLFWDRADVVGAVAALYALAAAGALVVSRLGLHLFDIREPIVELTAVHYLYAGTGALVLAGAVRGPGRTADVAVALTAAAPPLVALGFVTRQALPQVGGALLMALGVWATAGLQLRELLVERGRPTGRRVRRVRRVLLGVSGLAVWAPMVLALAWAAGQHGDVPHLAVADMVPLHGMPNALGFTVGGLLARRPPRAGHDDSGSHHDEGVAGCG
jgi:hypothetical protein